MRSRRPETADTDKILSEQADLWARRLTLKQISKLTGFAPSYCRLKILERISVKKIVSRETEDGDTSGS